MGRESDRDGTDPSGDAWVVDHRPGEEGDTPHGQVNFVVQSASTLVAEELANEAYLAKGALRVDEADDVAIELQGKTSACNDGG